MSITLEQFKALKPGDKVRIIKIDNRRPEHWNSFGEMDMYAGQVVTIKSMGDYGFFIRDGNLRLGFMHEDIDSIVAIYEQWPKENLHITITSSRRNGKQDWIGSYIYGLCSAAVTKALEKPLIQIDKVIFNEPATIVLWKDGSKTVVKAGKDEYFDKEKGLAMAISKKVLGNKGNYFNTFKKHDAINDDEEVYVPLSLLKECTTLKKLKALIALMEG